MQGRKQSNMKVTTWGNWSNLKKFGEPERIRNVNNNDWFVERSCFLLAPSPESSGHPWRPLSFSTSFSFFFFFLFIVSIILQRAILASRINRWLELIRMILGYGNCSNILHSVESAIKLFHGNLRAWISANYHILIIHRWPSFSNWEDQLLLIIHR